jgi:hypothetical protein
VVVRRQAPEWARMEEPAVRPGVGTGKERRRTWVEFGGFSIGAETAGIGGSSPRGLDRQRSYGETTTVGSWSYGGSSHRSGYNDSRRKCTRKTSGDKRWRQVNGTQRPAKRWANRTNPVGADFRATSPEGEVTAYEEAGKSVQRYHDKGVWSEPPSHMEEKKAQEKGRRTRELEDDPPHWFRRPWQFGHGAT